MALDPEHHRAFLACEGNQLMTVFDLDKHAPIAFLSLPEGPDVIKFDPGLGGSMLPVTAVSFLYFTQTIRTTIASSKTFASSAPYTASPWTRKPTACIHLNRKRTAGLWRGWSSLNPSSPVRDENQSMTKED